jgi:hypothetical protein
MESGFTSKVVESVIQNGLAGLILYLIVAPIIKWFMARADKKDEFIKTLVETHFKHSDEQHEKITKAIEDIPIVVMKSMSDLYPPEDLVPASRPQNGTLRR